METGDPMIEAGSPERRELWRRDVGRAVELSPIPIDEDWIVAPTEGELERLRGTDGQTVWKRKLRSGVATPPVVCAGNIVVATDIPSGEVLGISPATGEVRWKWERSLGFLAATDSMLVFSGRGGRVVALDPGKGSVRWELHRPGSGWRPPAIDAAQGRVFVPIRPDTVLALDAKGTVLWTRLAGNWPHVVVGPEALVVSNDDSTLLLLDFATGNERGRLHLGAIVAGEPVVRGDTIYLALRSGTMLALDARTLGERWRMQFEPPLVSAPLVAERVIAQSGTRGRIYLLESANGAPIDTLRHPEALTSSPALGPLCLAAGGTGGTVVLFRRPK
jgi:outer membrane protein assembly factor BamB